MWTAVFRIAKKSRFTVTYDISRFVDSFYVESVASTEETIWPFTKPTVKIGVFTIAAGYWIGPIVPIPILTFTELFIFEVSFIAILAKLPVRISRATTRIEVLINNLLSHSRNQVQTTEIFGTCPIITPVFHA